MVASCDNDEMTNVQDYSTVYLISSPEVFSYTTMASPQRAHYACQEKTQAGKFTQVLPLISGIPLHKQPRNATTPWWQHTTTVHKG